MIKEIKNRYITLVHQVQNLLFIRSTLVEILCEQIQMQKSIHNLSLGLNQSVYIQPRSDFNLSYKITYLYVGIYSFINPSIHSFYHATNAQMLKWLVTRNQSA